MRIIHEGSVFSKTGGRTHALGVATCTIALALSCSSDDGTNDFESDQTGAGGDAWGGAGGSGFPPGSGGSGLPPGSGGAYVPPATCGNGVRDANEQCEGGDSGGSTCSSATMGAMPEGTVSCTPGCQLNTTGCFGNLGTGGAGTGGSGFGGMPGTGGSGLGGDTGAGGSPPAGGPVIPAPTSACPNFVDGTATFTADNRQRQVRLWIDAGAAAAQDGPLVFYWYGTGGSAQQAVSSLGNAGIQRITSLGGIVVAATHVTTGGGILPWLSGGPEDLALTDQVVACAKQSVGIDTKRIHTLGFSAGALFAGRLSVERSSYIASVATFSGGGGGTLQDPNNKFAGMLIHGGSGDEVVINFETASQDFHKFLKDRGHFAIICNHGGGHRVSDAASAVQFLLDHPYGAVPSPYAGGLPGGFPSYCTP